MQKEEIKYSYETLWKFIIRPPRDEYDEDLLVDAYFTYKNRGYQRKDYDLISSEGYTMKCSLVEPVDSCRPSIEMPLILYLHGNSSSRLEGLNNLKLLLDLNINLFVFDFPGCGLSGGEYISLGYHEKNDVKILMDFIDKIPGVGNIGIWGRSMGAATTLLYTYTDPRVKAICVDSPFERFEKLAEELVIKQINLPKFLIAGALKIIKSTVKSKNGLDISKLNPIEKVEKTFQPAIFVHAINDELINVEHSINLFNNYGGPKSLKCCDVGGHNTKRPKIVRKEIGEFFKKYLCENADYENNVNNDMVKKYFNQNNKSENNNIINDLNNYDNNMDYECEENEEEEDDNDNNNIEINNINYNNEINNNNYNNIDINDDIYEEDYIMNQIIESQKNEMKEKNKVNKNIKIKKGNKNNIEEKRIEKIMKEEKAQIEQVKQALLNLNINSNNNNINNNNINNINNINIIDDDIINNDISNEEEEEYKNNSGNNNNFENGGNFK